MTSTNHPRTSIQFLDLPPKTFIGIDLTSFDSSPNFHGVINVPPGLHFLYTGTDATLSIRHGRWLEFDDGEKDHADASLKPSSKRKKKKKKQKHVVLRWNPEIESLDLLDPSSDPALAAVGGISSLQGRGLVDYTALREATYDLRAKQSSSASSSASSPAEIDPETWTSLTRHVAASTLTRILGPSMTISSVSSSAADTEKIPGLSDIEAARVLYDHHDHGGDGSTSSSSSSLLGFVAVDLKRTWPEGAIGSERSERARDRSWYLGKLIDDLSPSLAVDGDQGEGGTKDRKVGAREILAELQFCFVSVLTLANYSCLEQWKRILGVLFTAKTAILEVEGFFIEALKVLRQQLERVDDVDGGLFEMADEVGSAWLRALLRKFGRLVNEIVVDGDGDVEMVRVELKRLEEWLRETYGWEDERNLLRRGIVELEDGERVELQMDGLDEEEETGEYAPVVVEL